MYNLLKGKRGIIFGALWKLTVWNWYMEGGICAFGWDNWWAWHKTGSQIIPADATSVADLEILVDKAVEALGDRFCSALHRNVSECSKRKSLH
jgi:enoyl-[acyl-carrier protein] reductase I